MGNRPSARQLGILTFISLLSPLVRLLPASALRLGGSAGWLSPLLALPLVALYSWLTARFSGEKGLFELLEAGFGRHLGRLFAAITALWLSFYCGIILRAASERLVNALYPETSAAIFILAAAIGVAVTLLGSERALFRSAELVLPIILAVFGFALVFSLDALRPRYLLPLGLAELKGAALGALPAAEISGVSAYFLFFEPGEGRPAERAKWVAAALFTAFLMSAATVGALSPELAEGMMSPSLTLVRNIDVFGSQSRVDALMVAVWVVTDFAILASLLRIAAEIIEKAAPRAPKKAAALLPAALAALAAFLLSDTAFGAEFWCERVAPAVNGLFAFAAVPITLAAAGIRNYRA